MERTTRRERLIADQQMLDELKASSSIFDYEAVGDPPDHYVAVFHGQGLCRDETTRQIVRLDEHRCELCLSLSYPQAAPDLRWLTPLVHPNISFGGFIRLEDVGLPWDERVGLDVVCERLWDVARLAYCDLQHATNASARQWVERQTEHALPVDPRPLRDRRLPGKNANVVRYRRRDGRRILLPEPSEAEVLYIDEHTPVPQLPGARREPPDAEGEILYIGE